MNSDAASSFSSLMHLLGVGFCHPVPEFHARLEDGSYQAVLSRLFGAGLGIDASIADLGIGFAQLEADYIHWFDVGDQGRPLLSLHAADYDELLGGRPRPEFLLDYVTLYRHFGLRARDDGEDNELPDHLVCQLEFLAWLAHLEVRSSKPGFVSGYRHAQSDFLERRLLPFLQTLSAKLQDAARCSEAMRLYAILARTACDAGAGRLVELRTHGHNDTDSRPLHPAAGRLA